MDYFIGIDVSKETLDLAVLHGGEVVLEQQIPNNKTAVRAFVKEFSGLYPKTENQTVVCMEHTGIYNAIALEVFYQSRFQICLEPALRIRQSMGMIRGKNDKVDARRIAIFAFKNGKDLTLWSPPRPVIVQLQSLLVLRERLLKVRTQLEVPFRESAGFTDKAILKRLKAHTRQTLKGVVHDIEAVDRELKELLASDSKIHEQVNHITSVPGVGPITALNMIVTTREFSRITEAKKFACYAGVAPFEHSSGSSIRGKTRVSHLANMTIKTLFHMAAMSAIQCCPEIKAFYDRKVAQGKNRMSVINAVRNKLISRVFACVNGNRMYQNNYQLALD